MEPTYALSHHARHRSEQRLVPNAIIQMILDYGDSRDAGDGVRKFALSKASLKTLRGELGKAYTDQLHRFRTAYVVAHRGKVITVAFSSSPLFH